ncbi:MAG: ammonium transporter [Paludibacter sp.]|nr:ammonium transporter [Paludibacter sp.]
MKIYIFIAGLILAILTVPTLVTAQDTTAMAGDTIVATTTDSIIETSTEVIQEATTPLDSGNTAWIIVATILVLMMTIPGLALFYGGRVRAKNILSIIMQCFILVGVVTLLWFSFGYSWAFGTGLKDTAAGFFIGGFDKVFLNGVTLESIGSTGIPEVLFALFQCMFAIITPALIIGAFAERIKFTGYLLFISLWVIFAYFPMAHWVWGGGWLASLGAIDFAGGTVVHINAGVSALIMALLIGKRKGYKPNRPVTPHNIPFVFIGAAMLWLGWFGFNAGSGLAADGLASRAFLVTHVATATALVTWIIIDWTRNKRPTIVGASTAAVAGLVAITPAAGTAGIFGAMAIGFASAFICFFMVAVVKEKLGYDDSLDAFGVHGIGGIIGSILTGIFIVPDGLTGIGLTDSFGGWEQIGIQTIATIFTIAFSAIVTYILFKLVDKTIGIRASAKVEEEGLDIYEHGESAYN